MPALIDPYEAAAAEGVCPRTAVRRWRGPVERIGNKAFLSAGPPSVEKRITLQEAADRIGCSRSTVLRVLGRNPGLGHAVGRRRFVFERDVEKIREGVLRAPRFTLDPEAMRNHAIRMAKARWEKQAHEVSGREVAGRSREGEDP